MDRPPGEVAVADLAPSRRPYAADLPHRIRREIVVQHEGLLISALERINILLVLAGTERRNHERLRLAAGEQRAAMRAWQDADLADDWPHRSQIASVNAMLDREDARADDVLLKLLEGIPGLCDRRDVGAFR